MEYVIGIGALAIFIWLLIPERPKRGASSRDSERREMSGSIGVGTGLMGGDIEDASIARYALSRTPKDPNSSDARDLGSALGMQNIDPPQF